MRRTRPKKTQAKHYDRTPIMYGTIKVDGVEYEIQFWQRYGDDLYVMASPEMGGLGPFYGYPLEVAEAQMKDAIKERRSSETGWTDGEWVYSSRHGRYEKNHGYGGKKMQAKKWSYTKGKGASHG
jgi:hypothetical protein